MFDCKVCGCPTYTTYICSDCNLIKDACNLYGKEVVINCIKKVLIRDEKQQQFKIDRANEEADGTQDDSSYIKKDDKWIKRESERLKDKTTK